MYCRSAQMSTTFTLCWNRKEECFQNKIIDLLNGQYKTTKVTTIFDQGCLIEDVNNI